MQKKEQKTDISHLMIERRISMKTVPLSKIIRLQKLIDKKHPKEIYNDYDDGYDMAVAEINQILRDFIEKEKER